MKTQLPSEQMTKPGKIRGRGTASRIDARYLPETRQDIEDGWTAETDEKRLATTVTVEHSKTIITRNHSPDIPFEASINPYRGCEHGCIYCYARPAHAYMDLSPGIDFESKLFAKPDAPELLEKELAKPGYHCTPIALGSNTDPYQPVEREWKITRQIIEVLQRHDHPLTIVTKSRLVERDIDLLAAMAKKQLVQVFISVTTLDPSLAQRMEPRATSPQGRLAALAKLHDAGIPTGVMFAPVIPALNDTEMESVLDAAADTGVINAGYVMLRLPHEIRQLFREWLEINYPLKAEHVMSLVRDIRGGRENDPRFKSRMRGEGVFADMIERRFRATCKRLGLNNHKVRLDTSRFELIVKESSQLQLF